jgi:opacity protein-like surface antigen
MKNIICALLLYLCCNTGYAEEHLNQCQVEDCGHFYAGALGGLNFETDINFILDQKTGWLVGIFAGYQFASNLRVEGEFTYARNHLKVDLPDYNDIRYQEDPRIHIDRLCLLGNILYEFPICTNVSPYFGVGGGYGWRHTTSRQYRHTSRHFKNKFVWQGIAGIAYRYCDYKFGVDYRRIDVGTITSENAMTCSIAKHF